MDALVAERFHEPPDPPVRADGPTARILRDLWLGGMPLPRAARAAGLTSQAVEQTLRHLGLLPAEPGRRPARNIRTTPVRCNRLRAAPAHLVGVAERPGPPPRRRPACLPSRGGARHAAPGGVAAAPGGRRSSPGPRPPRRGAVPLGVARSLYARAAIGGRSRPPLRGADRCGDPEPRGGPGATGMRRSSATHCGTSASTNGSPYERSAAGLACRPTRSGPNRPATPLRSAGPAARLRSDR